MRRQRVEAPRIAGFALRLFHFYARWYMYWNLHTIRVNTLRVPKLAGMPVVVCMNHASWWDPLVAMTLALRLFPQRSHYAPMDATALSNFGFFKHLGFFGVETGSAKGAAEFIRISTAILSDPDAMLWVTAQGSFRDVRERPVSLRNGLGHLSCAASFVVLPVAIEYVYWDERLPEVLVQFGDPIFVAAPSPRSAKQWTAVFAAALEETQNTLAEAAIHRDSAAFQILSGGRSGTGGVYAAWKWARATFWRNRFHQSHRAERL